MSVEIKGKDYVLVNERVQDFRTLTGLSYGIETTIVELDMDKGYVVMKATIIDNVNGKIVSSGTAYEYKDSSFINKTSFIENCETSAVGRALGFLGFGIGTSIASAEEVQNAIDQQPISNTMEKSLRQLITNNKIENNVVIEVLKNYGYEKLSDIKLGDLNKIKGDLI
jgi:hypothetical protein